MKIKLDEADLDAALGLWVDENFNGFALDSVTVGEKAVSIQVEKSIVPDGPVTGFKPLYNDKEDLGTIQRGGKAVGE